MVCEVFPLHTRLYMRRNIRILSIDISKKKKKSTRYNCGSIVSVFLYESTSEVFKFRHHLDIFSC